MGDENKILRVKIEYDNAISLSEFRDALDGLNSQYIKYVSQENKKENGDVLFIKK